jgi:hypothetical protein
LFGDAPVHPASQSQGGDSSGESATNHDVADRFSADDDTGGGIDSDNTWDV